MSQESTKQRYERDGYTPIMFAIKEKNYTLLDLLLKNATVKDVRKRAENNANAVEIAAFENDLRALQLLLASGKADFNSVYDKEGTECVEESYSILQLVLDSIIDNNDTISRWLIEVAKVDLNYQDSMGYTALFDCGTKLFQLMLEHGADPNLQEYEKKFTIIADCVVNCINRLEYLCYDLPEHLRDKIDFNVVDKYGNTPLHIAIYCSDKRAVKALTYTQKCDLDCVNADGETPLELAQNFEGEPGDGEETIVDLLLARVQKYKKQKIV